MKGPYVNLRRSNSLRDRATFWTDGGMSGAAAITMGTATSGLSGDFLRLIADSGSLVKAILLVLLGFSVLSWAVMIDRFLALRRAETDSLAGEKEI